jgi:hypothetical protein
MSAALLDGVNITGDVGRVLLGDVQLGHRGFFIDGFGVSDDLGARKSFCKLTANRRLGLHADWLLFRSHPGLVSGGKNASG